MFESFECQCIYVEVSNASHPKSGCVEFRAKLCTVCQARGELIDERQVRHGVRLASATLPAHALKRRTLQPRPPAVTGSRRCFRA